ncbi:MAG TPA: ComEC/Rec2 family competence protein [Flavobacteriaceae bacterium]|nr:ComEC/Rec2 family competence protein [Flavobacteriaceae bacterium]
MKPLNLPLIKFSLCFVLGILLGFWLPVSVQQIFPVAAGIFVLFLLVYFRTRNQLWQGVSFGLLAFALVVSLGMLTAGMSSPKNNPEHYVHSIGLEKTASEPVLVVGKVAKTLNPNRYSDKYILKLQQLGKQKVEGKILLNLRKDSVAKPISVGDKVFAIATLLPINKPRNPHQFDYNAYMKTRGVFRQIFVSSEEIRVVKTGQPGLLGYAENVRDKIVESLRENGFSKTQTAMIQALLLGQTQDITDKTYDQYAAAGVIHILSVSGLHVGFILAMLNFLLKPLEWIRYGKYAKIILLIVLLWGFALLAGFSSPVVRSVAMFSFVAIGLNWQRKTNLINILFMSLFVILLVAPRFVFDIGFQLSYLAVFSIVVFYPKVFGLYRPKTVVDKFIWGSFCLTFAAQIGVLPLSLFYFHQFPGISFFSNLVVIPYVGVLLAACILVIFLAAIGLLPEFLVNWTGAGIDLLNAFVAWCAAQERFLFQNIHFSSLQMLTSYLLIFCLVLAMWKFSFRKLTACLVACLLLLGACTYEKKQAAQSNLFLIFHKNRKTMLGFKHGKQLVVCHNLKTGNIEEEYSVKNFMIGEAVDRIACDSLQNIYRIKNNWLLVVDSTGVYQLPELRNNLVLLRNSPKINLDRLIKLLKPEQIIADGSNYHSFVNRWRKTCERKKIPFHYTRTDGAFVVEY